MLVHRFRRAVEGAQEGTRGFFQKQLDGFAPLQTMASLGGDISRLARKEYEDTMMVSNALYESFYKYADKLKGKKGNKIRYGQKISR